MYSVLVHKLSSSFAVLCFILEEKYSNSQYILVLYATHHLRLVESLISLWLNPHHGRRFETQYI